MNSITDGKFKNTEVSEQLEAILARLKTGNRNDEETIKLLQNASVEIEKSLRELTQ